jgi:hypothetical protein
MSRPGTPNPWSEINGGMRGSILLRIGAVMTILATMQNFGAAFMEDAPGILVSSAWLCWIMALWLLAAGFIWIGVHPFLGRFGLAVGAFHFLNGLFLLGVLFGGVKPFLPSVSLSIGRTLVLLFFVMLEKKHLRSFSKTLLVVVALLQFLKISLRIMEVLPSWGGIAGSGLDSLLLSLLAVAIFLVGKDVEFVENSWARELAANRSSGFGDFNNPEHDWNQGED